MAEEEKNEAMTDDQVLVYTQHTRKQIVQTLMKNNQVPTDRSEQSLLVAALDGMDRAALGNKRIKADEKTAQGISGAASVVANLLNQIGSMTKQSLVIDNLVPVEPPLLGREIPDPVLVPGELDTNCPQLDYASFVSQNNPIN